MSPSEYCIVIHTITKVSYLLEPFVTLSTCFSLSSINIIHVPWSVSVITVCTIYCEYCDTMADCNVVHFALGYNLQRIKLLLIFYTVLQIFEIMSITFGRTVSLLTV